MAWWSRLTNLVRRRDLNLEIDEELQFHLDARIQDNLASGMTDGEARRDAFRRFGSRAGLRERVRDANVLAQIERLWQDLRHGARVFARNPGLTTISIVSIAFGTGANVAIFSGADAMLLRPLPVLRPSELLAVGSRVRRGPGGFIQSASSYKDYLDIRDRARSFDGVAAYEYGFVGIATRAGVTPRVRMASFVSDNFFSVLGVDPQIGRAFLPGEAGAANPKAVVVLSDTLWRGHFDADQSVIGQTLRIAGLEFTIVGVAPERFTGLHSFVRESVFLPLGMLPRVAELQRPDTLDARDVRIFALKGRLRPGVTIADARAELATIASDLQRAYPDTNDKQVLVAQTELEYKFEQRPLDASLIVILTTLSVAVLCVACANVAGLLASRGPVRAREMALRLAVGASRARLVRQLITESLGIAIGGAIGGLLVAQVGIRLMRQIQIPTDMISPPRFELDERTLLFSLIVAVASALLVGLGPALQTTCVDLTTTLKTGDRGGAARRLTGRSVLVSVQVALSLVLLTISVFAVQIFSRELRAGPGFRTTRIAKATIDPGQARYTDAAAARFFARVLADARALPGVRSASLTSAMPMFSYQFVPIQPEGQPLPDGQRGAPAWASSVDDQYFGTMEIALLSGRAFTATDDADAAPVAIVNETLARHYWPDADPIGKRVQVFDRDRTFVQIVGVVKTTTFMFPGEIPQEGIYFPYLQRPRGQMVLLAQTAADSSELLEALPHVVQRQDKDVPVFDVQTMETFYAVVVTGLLNVVVRMVGGLGLMGLTLTMVGLYGLVSYAVSRRTREIGIRIAIGATYSRILAMILRQGMAPAWLGLAVGLVLSVVTGRVLFGLVPFSYRMDARTYGVVVPLVIVVTLLAAFVPARRAAQVKPTEALRCD